MKGTAPIWGVLFSRDYVLSRSGGVDKDFIGLLDSDWKNDWDLHRKGVPASTRIGRR